MSMGDYILLGALMTYKLLKGVCVLLFKIAKGTVSVIVSLLSRKMTPNNE